MAAKTGNNEGLRVLEDFGCEAVPGSEVSAADSAGRGINAGIAVSEPPACDSPARLTEELRSMSDGQLHALLKMSGPELNRELARAIRQIVLERRELLRDTLVTLNRIVERADAPEPQ